MKARDVMTSDPISVDPESSVVDAARLMLDRKISGVLIMDGGNLVGILSEGDLLRRGETGTARQRPHWLELFVGPGKLADEYVRLSGRKVHEVMTPLVQTIPEDADLEEVVRSMESNGVKRLPVMRGNAVVGIITRSDLVRAFVNAPKQPSRRYNDDEIQRRLLAELQKQHWAPLGTIDVSVNKGVVTLSGAVLDDRQRSALEVAAENITGVLAVRNQLVWLEPVSGMVVER